MVCSHRPAVVANLTEHAIPPGAAPALPTPAIPTTATEATGRGGNHRSYSVQPIAHRGFTMVEGVEDDGDGFSTSEYLAWRPSVEFGVRGETLHLRHQRFGFEPTQEWFASEVDRVLDERARAARKAQFEIGRDGIVCLGFLIVSAISGWVLLVVS